MRTIKLLVILAGLFFIFVVSFLKCEQSQNDVPRPIGTNQSEQTLPLRAKIIEDLGNGWVYFELDNKIFLYKQTRHGNAGYSALTMIGEKGKN